MAELIAVQTTTCSLVVAAAPSPCTPFGTAEGAHNRTLGELLLWFMLCSQKGAALATVTMLTIVS
jgi:hypothetical protein